MARHDRVSTRPALIAWTRNAGRLTDLATEIGADLKIIWIPALQGRWKAPLRYAASALLTVSWLTRTRPQVVVVSCPPPFAALLVAVYASAFDAGFLLDAHPGAFGHRGRVWKHLLPLQRALARIAVATMVTEPELGEVVRSWGGRPLVFHEAPVSLQKSRPPVPATERPRVLMATIFDLDEPLEAITAAACDLVECDVFVTGDPTLLDPELRRRLVSTSHVTLTGWLEQQDYLTLVHSADVTVALTTDAHSVSRSAFEAAYLERTTVLSDTKTLRACFSPSLFVENTSSAVVAGVRQALAGRHAARGALRERRTILESRWERQRVELDVAISEAAKLGTRSMLRPTR
jgi:hypothetical protein